MHLKVPNGPFAALMLTKITLLVIGMSKLRNGTSKTKQKIFVLDIAVHSLLTNKVFLYHVTISCKGPIACKVIIQTLSTFQANILKHYTDNHYFNLHLKGMVHVLSEVFQDHFHGGSAHYGVPLLNLHVTKPQ